MKKARWTLRLGLAAVVFVGLFLVLGGGRVEGGANEVLAVKALATGQFESARELLSRSDLSEPAAVQLRALLDDYDRLHRLGREAYGKAYAESCDKMQEAMARAAWRETLLNVSENYDLSDEKKAEQEQEFREKIREEWIAALAQLTLMVNLSERVDWPHSIDAETEAQLTSKALEIAQEYEADGEWLEAYGQVYYYLTTLKRRDNQYDEHVAELLRRAVVSDMYVPDPNQDVISWQERRKDISFDMIYAAINVTDVMFVETPNYRDMALAGLRNCKIMADMDALTETFASLADAEARSAYLEQVQRMADEVGAVGAKDFTKQQLLEIYWKMLRTNRDTAAFPEEVLLAEFTEGAFSALDDYTYIVWPADAAEFRKDMTSEFFGVGIVINKVGGVLKVDSLLEDAPAMKAGLDAGDSIVAVNGKSTKAMSITTAVRRITGPENTPVTLTIEREGLDKPFDVTITRSRIQVQTIKGLYRNAAGEWEYYLDAEDKIAYIRVTNFAAETTGRLLQVLTQLKKEGLNGLVLDLRDNTGGYLNAAVEMVDDFIDKSNLPIVSTKSPRYPDQGHADYPTAKATFDSKLPMVVLVNSASASASEIVSGALKDHRRALIVGTRTFGKGSVQQIQEMRPSDAQLKITMAYYYLPSGRRVNRNPKDKANDDYGVEPHVKVELTGEQMETLYKVRRDAGVLYLHNDASSSRQQFTAQALLESDPQLSMARLCLKAQLIGRTLGVEDFGFTPSQSDAAIAANAGSAEAARGDRQY